MNANEIADRLDGAAALIEERGHARGALTNDAGGLCMIGALRLSFFGVVGNNFDGHKLPAGTNEALRAARNETPGALHHTPSEWNDIAPTGEVCALLRRAAQLARQQAPVAVEVVNAV